MEKKYFPLGNPDDRLFVRIVQIVFGAACILMAMWWLIISLNSDVGGVSVYVTVSFLCAIGAYLILSGFGKTRRFIAFESDKITIRQNPVLPAMNIAASQLNKIEIYPLSIKFIEQSGNQYILRLGTINYETNEKIVDEIVMFAEERNIKYEIKEEL